MFLFLILYLFLFFCFRSNQLCVIQKIQFEEVGKFSMISQISELHKTNAYKHPPPIKIVAKHIFSGKKYMEFLIFVAPSFTKTFHICIYLHSYLLSIYLRMRQYKKRRRRRDGRSFPSFLLIWRWTKRASRFSITYFKL